jgi:diguanylate cyclase (GGDEF)-like protein
MSSFRLKLVVYFLLLSLLPLAAAFAGFASVAKESETRLVDARLQAGLHAALAAYEERLAAAEASARALAGSPSFQGALARHDRRAVERAVGSSASIVVQTRGGRRIGGSPGLTAERRVNVVGPHGTLGTVIAWVPLDERFLAQLRGRAGLDPKDVLVLLRNGRIIVGPSGFAGSIAAPPGEMRTTKIGGVRYRALVAHTLSGRPGAALAALSLQSRIDTTTGGVEKRLLLALVILLGLVASVGYFEGRTIVRTISELVAAANAMARGRLSERVRVRGRDELALLGRSFNDMAEQLEARLHELEAERARVREAFARFGEALAATHDVDQLLRVIVDVAVEATGASAGVLVAPSGDVFHAGEAHADDVSLELPLAAGRNNFGTLTLLGPEFGAEERMTAVSLVSHAAVALENARLHRIVERQALVDGLTGLANRRHGENVLEAELARTERFGGPLTIVVADLDDFKDVNDRFGHMTGDCVLRDFGAALRSTVRDVDLACRWGGEEFVLVLPGTDAEGGASLAERVREQLRTRTILALDGTPIAVTASFGVASSSGPMSAEELLARADGALYEAKRAGKDRVERAVEIVAHP